MRVPPSGTWERRRADLFAAAEDWIGRSSDLGSKEALEHLVRRYLGGFGPARVVEIADWAGLAVTPVKEAVGAAEPAYVSRRDRARSSSISRAPRCRPPTRPRRRASSASGKRRCSCTRARRRSCPEEYRPLVFNTKTPHSVNTFLVDGAVAGTWRVERARDKATLTLRPFAPLPRGARRPLVDEAERLVRFHEDDAASYAVRFA